VYREISLRGYDAVRDFSLPTIAVIDGLCIGGGNNLALACDIRLASPRASFGIPAVRHGIVYDRPTVTRMVELMGSGRASHLLFTAGRIDARGRRKPASSTSSPMISTPSWRTSLTRCARPTCRRSWPSATPSGRCGSPPPPTRQKGTT
jgi:hypothetical protein